MVPNRHERAAAELALALGLLVRRIRLAAPAASRDLSWTQMAVIARLETDGPATTADLARAEGIKPQSMGAALAVLEQMGLVERRPHPTDGRQVNIALTATGAQARRETHLAKRTWLAEAIARLDASERKHVPAAAALLRHLAEL